MTGALYLISTPIGNRQDITIRAVRTIFACDILLCEDTRKTANLMQMYKRNKDYLPFIKQFQPKLISYHEHNEALRIPEVLNYLKQNLQVGLVSNAGTPTIADPGYKLIRTCVEAGDKVFTVPGPSAFLTALVASGLPTDKFLFLGFLPKKSGKRTSILEAVKAMALKPTVVIYESPYRVNKLLTELESVFSNIQVTLASELTKMFESIETKTIEGWQQQLSGKKLKGEIVAMFRPE